MIDAAFAAIRRHGPSVTFEAIAQEAGVSRAVLYSHFTDRQGVALAIGERLVSVNAVGVEILLSQFTDLRLFVRSAIDAYLSTIEAEPDVLAFLWSPSNREALDVAFLHLSIESARLIGDALRDLDITSSFPIELSVVAAIGQVHLASLWWITGSPGAAELSRDELIDTITELILRGIEPQLTESSGSETQPVDIAMQIQRRRETF